MKFLRDMVIVLCIGFVAAPALGLAEAAPAPAADDAAQEEKARNYFTDLEVVDQNGRHLRFYSDVLKGRVVLINFIFTNCKDACPLMTHKLNQVRGLMAESIKDEVWFVSLSVDPERDTPEAMKDFARKQEVDESRWLFLTGPKQNLDFIVKRLGQYSEEVDAHSTLMLAGNDRTRHWKRVLPMVPPAGVAEQLRAIAEDSPG